MTVTSPDFPAIQTRLKALGLYDHPIDDEWGPGMSSGVDQALSLLERAHADMAHPPAPAAAVQSVVRAFRNLPAGYGWLRDVGPLPRHLAVALSLIGTLEGAGGENNPTILGWAAKLRAAGINVSGYTADSVAWCGLFVGYVMLEAAREPIHDPLWALNWAKYGVDGGQPDLGDILTFKREGGGHVAFYIAEDAAGFYHVLGGNQSDRVSIMRIAKTRMYSCRQPAYNAKPTSVRPYVVSPSGIISRNEA